jgi:Domain of unknown function (DUF6532)
MQSNVRAMVLEAYSLSNIWDPMQRNEAITFLLEKNRWIFADPEVYFHWGWLTSFQKRCNRFMHPAIIQGIYQVFFVNPPFLGFKVHLARRACMLDEVPSGVVAWMAVTVNRPLCCLLT